MSGPASVTTEITFSTPPPPGTRAYRARYANNDTGIRDTNLSNITRNITVENIRGREHEASLDTTGYQLVNQPAKHTSFIDDAQIEREYYPESVELFKQVTGASKVVIFDHTIRRRRPGAVDSSPTSRQPAAHAHVDQTTKASIIRVHRHLPANEVPELLKRRFQIINLWRPISHPAIDWPLALCDYRSVDVDKDTFPVALIYQDREGETRGVNYNPKQKWQYFHAVSPQEAILIKCYDSVQDGSVAVFTPHSAFQDPTTPSGTPPRESIELRALVFYD